MPDSGAPVTLMKPIGVNPLKVSPPLGAAMAFLGVERCLPLLHGSQGCTAFALVLMVKHYREAIPLQTTALNEITTILGGTDNLEKAIGTIREKARPALIGLCSTALTETRGEDIAGDLGVLREAHPEWQDLDVVYAAAPDYGGGLETGWAAAVEAMIGQLSEPGAARDPRRVNLLAGSHLSPGDLDELRDLVEGFGLEPVVLPDLAGSLDGHVADSWMPTSLGGTPVEAIRRLGGAGHTLALGEHMGPAAEALERRAGVPFTVLGRLTGLAAADRLIAALMEISGRPAPARVRRERSRLIDAMLDGHFFFGRRRVAVAAEPDLLADLAGLLGEMGATVAAAIAPCGGGARLGRLPAAHAAVGDLDDLERAAVGCDLLIGPSHVAEAAARLGIPLYRAGFPVTDRLGAAQQVSVGYRGTRELIFAIGNRLMEREAASHPVAPPRRPPEEGAKHDHAPFAAH